MDIVKIIGIAFVTVICSTLIKSVKPELAFAVTSAGTILILLLIVGKMTEITTIFSKISMLTGTNNHLLKIILKIVGIGYLTELSAGILTDLGSQSTADKVVLGGKLTIVIMSFPVIESLLSIIQEFLKII